MKLFKKLGTYFSMLSFILSGTSFKSIASEGEEGAESEEGADQSDASKEESDK